jgi:FtsZ-binding cell division protein ZapB
VAEIEQLNEEIRTLVRERQDLRTSGAKREELERNRERIVSCQWRLAQAFSEHYTPHRPEPSAA